MDGSIASPALPSWVPRLAVDVDSFHGMAAAGILRPDERVELIEGELVRMSPIGNRHVATVLALTRALVPRVMDVAEVSVQNPIRLGRYSEPEPDLALLRRRPNDDWTAALPQAADVMLIIEVADTTLRFDREVKAPLYAQHGIPELWIVDLEGRVILVHRDPVDGRYASVDEILADGVLSPRALPELMLKATDVLR